MKRILLFLSFLFLNYALYAQSWLWAKQATGDAQEDDYGLAIDKKGNTYLTGEWSYCDSNPDTLVFGNCTLKDIDKDFLVKYDPNGNVLWARSARGNAVGFNWIQGFGVAADVSDNVYEIGVFEDTAYFGAYKLVSSNSSFLVKYDANGNVLWAEKEPGVPNAITVDGSNNTYVTGLFVGSATFGATTLLSNGSASNVFLVKYDSNGKVLWATAPNPPPTTGTDNQGLGVATDKGNNVYITGYYRSPTITFGSYTLINSSINAFLVKYDSAGNVLWAISSVNSGPGGAEGYAVTVDGNNDVSITGLFNADSITFGNQTLGPTTGAIFLAKYNSSGGFLWARSIGSSVSDGWYTVGYALTTDQCDDIYVAGGCAYTISSGPLFYSVSTNSDDPSFVMEFDYAGNPITGFIMPDGGDDYIGLVMDQNDNLFLGGDLMDNMSFGNDTLKPFCSEASFLAKFTLGKAGCCKNFIASISGNINITPGDSSVLTALPPGLNYVWSTGATSQSITIKPSASTTYSVNVSDTMGSLCSSVVEVIVGENCRTVFIPSAFSPNNDGQNDILYVRGNCINTMDFVIYDRWGNKVFESTNINEGWDGTYKGQSMNTGTYVYCLKGTLLDGTLLDKKGSIALVR